jgi:hypothetical protein
MMTVGGFFAICDATGIPAEDSHVSSSLTMVKIA